MVSAAENDWALERQDMGTRVIVLSEVRIGGGSGGVCNHGVMLFVMIFVLHL